MFVASYAVLFSKPQLAPRKRMTCPVRGQREAANAHFLMLRVRFMGIAGLASSVLLPSRDRAYQSAGGRKKVNRMKSKIVTLVALLACAFAGLGQTNTASAEQTESAPAVAVPAPVVDAAPAPAPEDSPIPTPEPQAPTPEDLDDGAVIPLMLMDDVGLKEAIQNLARQADLNILIDPKLGFGQTGPDGKPGLQPTVSLRFEKVTARQALYAVLANHGLQLTEDPMTKISRVTIKDPAAPDPLVTRVFQLKYASPSNIIDSVTAVIDKKRSHALPDVRTSQVVTHATEKEQLAIEKLIEKLDTPTKQVLIEARLVETSMNPSTIKGMDWSGTLKAQNLRFGNNLQTKPTEDGLSDNKVLASTFPKMVFDTVKGFNPTTAFLDADGVNAVLSFMNQYSEAKVLSAPRTVTLDNEKAFISVTRAEPIFKNTAGTQGSPGGSEVTYTNLGVILEVTPRISANNLVNLRVVPEVSRVYGTVKKVVASTENEADQYDIRKIDTRVMIPSGNTLVLGGLVQDDIRKSNNKVPILGDIPLLGYAFRSDSKSRQKANLLIFITPTIVQDSDFQPSSTKFLSTPAPLEDRVEPDWSAWDSGKPRAVKKKAKTSFEETME